MSRPKNPILQPQTFTSRILRTPEILARYGISLPTLFRWQRLGQFPRGFKLVPGSRMVGWYESELADFEAKRKAV